MQIPVLFGMLLVRQARHLLRRLSIVLRLEDLGLVESQLGQLLGRHLGGLVAALIVDAAAALVALHLRHALRQGAAWSCHTGVGAVADVAATQCLRHNAQRVAIDVDL